MSLTEDEKNRAARAAYMRAYSKKRRRSSQKARSREKEYRDRYWLRKFHEMQAASGGGKDGWNGKTE